MHYPGLVTTNRTAVLVTLAHACAEPPSPSRGLDSCDSCPETWGGGDSNAAPYAAFVVCDMVPADMCPQANAGHEADKAVRQLLDEVRLELAAERMAHARTCRMLLETQEQLEEAGREGSVSPGEATGVRRAVLDMESRLAEQDLEACRLEVETSQQEVAASTPEARAEVEVVAEVVAEADMVTPTSEAAAAPPAVAAGVAPAAAEPAEAESAQELQEDTDGPPDVKGTEAASAEEGSDELTEVVGTPAAAAEGGEGAGEASAAEPQAAAPPAKSME